MILVDTSVWIEMFRDNKGHVVKAFRERVKDEILVLTRFTQLELLQGAKGEREWNRLDEYLATQLYLEASKNTWKQAARLYFDLRRKGITVNSPIDCCIAQIAIESNVLLLHQDSDFESILLVSALNAERFQPTLTSS